MCDPPLQKACVLSAAVVLIYWDQAKQERKRMASLSPKGRNRTTDQSISPHSTVSDVLNLDETEVAG